MGESSTVFKYPLMFQRVQDLDLPVGAKLLHVGEQRGDLFIWEQVNPGAPTEKRRFAIVGTGHAAPPDGVHLGSIIVGPDGAYVWHIFTLLATDPANV